jgi:hypothetical protein
MAEVEGLAAKHVEEITASHGKTKGKVTGSATWPAHARLFLRDWRGVPAADAFAKEWEKIVEKHHDAAKDGWTDYYAESKKGKTDKAFSAAVDAIEKGFLHYWVEDAEMRATLAKWRDDAKAAKLSPAATKRYDAVVVPFLDAEKAGRKAYEAINRKL